MRTRTWIPIVLAVAVGLTFAGYAMSVPWARSEDGLTPDELLARTLRGDRPVWTPAASYAALGASLGFVAGKLAAMAFAGGRRPPPR